MSDSRERIILHMDMDAFFAAVEARSNPRLAGKPIIVCGNPDQRSVVSTASYEARAQGVHSGMPVTEARRRCPDGIYLPGNPEKYVFISVEVLNLLKEYADAVEPFSIDEAFLDVTHVPEGRTDPEGLARRIKKAVWSRVGLTCSIGIGPNKLVSKMASSLEKPDGLSRVRQGEFLEVFGAARVSRLWGVGEKTEKQLNAMGIQTIGDLAGFQEQVLVRTFGVEGERLHFAANGIDDTPVVPYYEGIEAKSVGHEHTLSSDVSNREYLESVILRLSDQVARRLRAHHYLGRTVTLKVRHADFHTFTRQKVLGVFTDEERTIYGVARMLLRKNWNGEKVRLLGVSVSSLIRFEEMPQALLFTEDEKYRDLLTIVDRVKDTFGEDALTRARLVK
jgi:DNA polymerase-4